MAKIADSAVAAYLRATYGGDFEHAFSIVQVDAAGESLVLSDPERTSLIIVNLGGNFIYVRPGPVFTNTNGIVLVNAGGFMEVNVTEDATLPTLDWSAYAPVGTNATFVLAVRRYAALPIGTGG